MKIIGIYKITSPSNKIYIGQSVNIHKRWQSYRMLRCKFQRHLYSSFLKYGVETHIFEIIQECEKEELNTLEKYYINYYDIFNTDKGLNIREGGGSRAKFSEEARQLMSINRKGKYSGENNPMNKPGIREKCKGHLVDIGTRSKISTANKGKVRSDSFKENLKISMSKGKVLQYSLDDEFLAEYKSAHDAFNIIGIRNVDSACKNKRKTVGGFKWKYKKETEN